LPPLAAEEGMMKKPFDLEAVDGLLKNAIAKFMQVDPAQVDPPFIAECTAAEVLTEKHRTWEEGDNGCHFVQAGFRFAMRLCCRVLADPLHVDELGVESDWIESRKIVELGYQNQNEERTLAAKRKRGAAA
jgi:hypothetical protein